MHLETVGRGEHPLGLAVKLDVHCEDFYTVQGDTEVYRYTAAELWDAKGSLIVGAFGRSTMSAEGTCIRVANALYPRR